MYSSYQFAAKCQEYIHLLAAHPRFLLPQPPLPASLSLLPAFCRHSWISRFPVFSSYPAVYRPSQRPSFRFGSTDNYHTSGKSLLILGEIGIFLAAFAYVGNPYSLSTAAQLLHCLGIVFPEPICENQADNSQHQSNPCMYVQFFLEEKLSD